MTFTHPWWFAGGAAVLALAVGYWLAHRRRVRHTVRFANLALLRSVAPKRPSRWRHAPFAVILLALVVLTVALAGPTAQVRVPRNEATVMLAIDTSLSMQAADVSPNRLVAAQQAATQFVDDLTPGVNLGIVSFAGIASVLVSPTTDREAAKQAISSLQLDERTATGEAVISALQAIEVFSRTLDPGAATAGSDAGTGSAGGDVPDPGAEDGQGGQSPDEQQARSRVPARIVLMTDGKRTVGRTEVEAAERAAQAEVPVSVIAFGTDHGSINFDGSPIPVPLDTAAMQDIAEISGGDFHTAASAEELRAVYSQLGEQIGYETQEEDVSRPWVIAGTVLLLLGAAGALALGGRIP